MKTIISASRRTDIPHYFAEWFANRRRAGHADFRNAFGGKGSVSLKPADVAGYLFWTKYAKPFHNELKSLRADGIPYAFQYTITGLGTSPVEPHIPRTSAAIDDFLGVRSGLPSSTSIEWRYDPLVISDDIDEAVHVRNFAMIAKALHGATAVVNTSFTEPYAKSIRRMKDHGRFTYRALDPARHRQASKRHPDIGQMSRQRALTLLNDLSAIAEDHGMQLRLCCNPEFGLPGSQCIGAEMFAGYGDVIEDARSGPSRPGCRCLKSVDIGMDNTCIGGCTYCYVVTSQNAALRNFGNHDPQAVMMR